MSQSTFDLVCQFHLDNYGQMPERRQFEHGEGWQIAGTNLVMQFGESDKVMVYELPRANLFGVFTRNQIYGLMGGVFAAM